MNTLLIILSLICLVGKLNSLTIQCVYRTKNMTWNVAVISRGYSCIGKIVDNEEKTYVTAVSQNHEGHRSSTDVKHFLYSAWQTIPKLPKMSDSFFPNLEALMASDISLEVVSSDDFKTFPKSLRIVYLHRNKLTQIPSTLFKHLPNIDTITLTVNKIEHVGSNFFKYLNFNKLKRFSINNNKCTHIDWIHFGERNLLERLKTELATKCKPTQEMIDDEEIEELSEKFKVEIEHF